MSLKSILSIQGDMSFSYKQQTKQIYLDFLDEPQGSVRRSDQTHGIYTSYYVGKWSSLAHDVIFSLGLMQERTIR